MGFFSWFTSDTKKSIANSWSTRSTFPVHMVTEDGQIFTENNYEGYGVFGGKDLYVLSAEMNGQFGETEDETRNLFFDKIWVRGITNGDKTYCYKEHFGRYDDPLESEGGLTPNQLTSEHGWTSFGESGEFGDWAKQGLRMPKLVERLPNTNANWNEWWESLPYPESCPDQGFFYPDEEEDDEVVDGGDTKTWNEAPYGEGDE